LVLVSEGAHSAWLRFVLLHFDYAFKQANKVLILNQTTSNQYFAII